MGFLLPEKKGEYLFSILQGSVILKIRGGDDWGLQDGMRLTCQMAEIGKAPIEPRWFIKTEKNVPGRKMGFGKWIEIFCISVHSIQKTHGITPGWFN